MTATARHHERRIPMDRRLFLARVRKALSQGAVRNGRTVIWNLTASSKHPCEQPLLLCVLEGTAKEAPYVAEPLVETTGFLELHGRCRKCPACRDYRRRLWIARALAEQNACPGRTWFVTLTANPEMRDWVDHQAQSDAFRASGKYVPAVLDLFPWRARVMKREAASFMKRLRERTADHHTARLRSEAERLSFGEGRRWRKVRPKLRFLAVTEPHKDGNVHLHLLVHEWSPALRCRWVDIEAAWGPLKRGFVVAKLVTGSAAPYVSKYLAKELDATVHASNSYGRISASAPAAPKAAMDGRRSESEPDATPPPPTKGVINGLDCNFVG